MDKLHLSVCSWISLVPTQTPPPPLLWGCNIPKDGTSQWYIIPIILKYWRCLMRTISLLQEKYCWCPQQRELWKPPAKRPSVIFPPHRSTILVVDFHLHVTVLCRSRFLAGDVGKGKKLWWCLLHLYHVMFQRSSFHDSLRYNGCFCNASRGARPARDAILFFLWTVFFPHLPWWNIECI